MQRNAAHVTQTLSSSGASVMRFEVQKIVKGGSKARLLILNVDVKVLIQVRSYCVLMHVVLCSCHVAPVAGAARRLLKIQSFSSRYYHRSGSRRRK